LFSESKSPAGFNENIVHCNDLDIASLLSAQPKSSCW